MALHVTQCPSCDSTFNTSARLLEAAHGLVRCGACLSVFEANENYIDSLPPASNDELDPGADNSVFISGQEDYFDPETFLQRSELSDTSEDQPLDDELSAETVDDKTTDSEDIENEEIWTITDLEVEHWDTSHEGNYAYDDAEFGQPGENTFIELPEAEKESEETDLSSTADSAEAVPITPLQAVKSEHTQHGVDLTTFLVPTDQDTKFELKETSEPLLGPSNSDLGQGEYTDNNINLLYDNLAFVPKDAIGITPDTEVNSYRIIDAVEQELAIHQSENTDITAESAPAVESKQEIRERLDTTELSDSDEELESLSKENLAAISKVDSSLELEQAKPLGRIKRTVVLTFVSLVLLLGLAGQFFWQRLPILSLDPQLRPGYELVCGLLNCELPAIQDLINIQTENLVIRSHPEFENSLVLTAVFRNIASFQQPFPIIELSFTDLDGQPVASREFYPAEYLSPALSAIANMPIGAPVQFSVELVDPGETAVNYHLDYKPFPRPF